MSLILPDLKAISLTQPWASLVVFGNKKYETRSWSTKYRGPLFIHAAKNFPSDAMSLCYQHPFNKNLRGHLVGGLELGALIGVVDLVEVYQTTHAIQWIKGDELAFGDYSSGRYAFKLENIREMESIPYSGKLGIWTIGPEVSAMIRGRGVLEREKPV